MTKSISKRAGIVDIYCNVDQALEDGNTTTALAGLEQAYALCQGKAIMLEGLAEYIYEKVSGLLKQGAVGGLEPLVSLAEQAAVQVENHNLVLVLVSLKARVYSETGRHDIACAIFEQLAREAEDLKWFSLAAEAWRGMGVAEHVLRRYQKASSYLRVAIALYAKTGRSQKQADSLCRLGQVELDAGFLDSALLAYEQAAALWYGQDELLELVKVWRGQCLCYLEQGLYEMALAKSDQVLEGFKQHQLDLVSPWLDRVEIFFSLGMYGEARELLESSFGTEPAASQNPGGDLARLWTGILEAHTGFLNRAVEMLTQSGEAYRKCFDYDMEAVCQCLAGLYLWLGGLESQAEERWGKTITVHHFRKAPPRLDGWLKRCLERIKIDFPVLNEAAGTNLEELTLNAAQKCGFKIV